MYNETKHGKEIFSHPSGMKILDFVILIPELDRENDSFNKGRDGFLPITCGKESLWQVNSVLHEDKVFQFRHKGAGIYSGTEFF